jgi:hypothetical protein
MFANTIYHYNASSFYPPCCALRMAVTITIDASTTAVDVPVSGTWALILSSCYTRVQLNKIHNQAPKSFAPGKFLECALQHARDWYSIIVQGHSML